MIVFWMVVAVALAMVVGALARTALRRAKAGPVTRSETNLAVFEDQLRELGGDLASGAISVDQFERARQELVRRLRTDAAHADPAPSASAGRKGLTLALALAVPLVAVGLYLKLGQPDLIDAPSASPQAAAQQQGHAGDMARMVGILAQKLQEDPNNGEGWYLLARSYLEMQQFPEAAGAFAKAAALLPPDATLLADYADAEVMANGRQWTPAAKSAVEKALAADPQHPKSLALAGTEAFHRGDYKSAVGYWERLAALVQPQSPEGQQVAANIAEAKSLAAGGKPGQAVAAQAEAPAAPAAPAAPGAGAAISGTVDLAPALKAKAGPEDVVFVFARAPSGPRMPVAAQRFRVKDLPAKFSLDDSQAMMPSMKLSDFAQVVVSARVSKSGDAIQQPGDLLGSAGTVQRGASGLALRIDQEAP